VRPLAGTTLLASAEEPAASDRQASDQTVPDEKEKKSEPDTLQKLLNEIFGSN
jgi:hypothetical protein